MCVCECVCAVRSAGSCGRSSLECGGLRGSDDLQRVEGVQGAPAPLAKEVFLSVKVEPKLFDQTWINSSDTMSTLEKKSMFLAETEETVAAGIDSKKRCLLLKQNRCLFLTDNTAVSYTHLTLPTIYSV